MSACLFCFFWSMIIKVRISKILAFFRNPYGSWALSRENRREMRENCVGRRPSIMLVWWFMTHSDHGIVSDPAKVPSLYPSDCPCRMISRQNRHWFLGAVLLIRIRMHAVGFFGEDKKNGIFGLFRPLYSSAYHHH